MNRTCEGRCGTHRGKVKKVKVAMGEKEWGVFYYCNEAIKKDRAAGFTVRFVPVN